jgi:hypothetical protein
MKERLHEAVRLARYHFEAKNVGESGWQRNRAGVTPQ